MYIKVFYSALVLMLIPILGTYAGLELSFSDAAPLTDEVDEVWQLPLDGIFTIDVIATAPVGAVAAIDFDVIWTPEDGVDYLEVSAGTFLPGALPIGADADTPGTQTVAVTTTSTNNTAESGVLVTLSFAKKTSEGSVRFDFANISALDLSVQQVMPVTGVASDEVRMGIEETAPGTPVVIDDGDCTTHGTQLHASWTSSSPESGISEYEYAIGTTPDGNEVVDWTSAGTNTEVTRSGLILEPEQVYYFAVRAKSGAGIWSSVGMSDGITYQLPQIGVMPADLTFGAVTGGSDPTPQKLSITNPGCGTLNWTISDDADWLSCTPASGDCTDETDEVMVSINIGLASGTYNATITISATSASNTPQTVPVTLDVGATSVNVTITTNLSPTVSGIKVIADGVTYDAPYTVSWLQETTHTIGVPSPQYSGSDVRYVFSRWEHDGGTETQQITVPSSPVTYTAYLVPQYLLTMNNQPPEGGSITATPEGPWYDTETVVSLRADANSGYKFSGWSGDISGSDNPASIEISGVSSVTANYEASPVVTDIPDMSFLEDQSLSIDLDDYVGNPGNANDKINWTYSGNTNIYVDIDSTTRVVTFTALLNWSGTEIITFTAEGPGGLIRSDSVRLTVAPVNDPPVLTSIGDKQVREGMPLQLTIAATDVDAGDTLIYSARPVPSDASWDSGTGRFDWTPGCDMVIPPESSRSFPMTFGVTDGQGASDQEIITVTVLNEGSSIAGENTPPSVSITSPPRQSQSNGDVSTSFTLWDAEGDNCVMEAEYRETTAASWTPATISGAHVSPGSGTLYWKSAMDEPNGQGVYYIQIRASDGLVYSSWSSRNVTINNTLADPDNHEPAVGNLRIVVIDGTTNQEVGREARTGDRLKAEYDFVDLDGDTEKNSVFAWYKYDVPVPGEQDRILSIPVRKGERWYYAVTPSDGKSFGTRKKSYSITVRNAPPQAQNARIQPSIPTSKDDLRATYTYSDPEDGNLEGDSEIQWYRDGVLQPGYRGEILPASATTRGDEWRFSVRPRDIDGAFGTSADSFPVTIANQKPVVEITSVVGTRHAVSLQGDITVIYNLKDEDGDRCRLNVYYQGGSAGIAKMAAHIAEATEGNNVITDVAPATGLALTWKSASNEPAGKDDNFRVGIIADDGIDKGEGVSKPFSVDNNKEPTVTDVAISPLSPFSSDNLMASYKFDDPDGDQESGSEIGWYKNGVEQMEYRNLKELPYTATNRDEDWYFTIQPKDGKEFGEMQTSPTVKIENAPPEATEVRLEPADATSNDNLKAVYAYNDADGDPEVGTQIRWYLNDSPRAEYDDQMSVPSTATAKDQVWYFTVQVSDGIAPGEIVTSNHVAVGNMAPLVRGLTVPPEGFRDVEIKLDLVDADNDKCSLEVEYRGGMASDWTPATIKEPLTDVSPGLVTRTWESAKDQDVQKPTKFQIRITPSDSLVAGDTVESEFFTLDNNVPPVASNLKILPPNPTTADNLVASYEYSDADGGAESGSEIMWYKDDSQTDYKGKTLLASATSKDQVWHFTVRPRDGAKFGDLQTSDPVTILNAPPLAKNVAIAPAEPKSDDILIARYDYRDLDEDRESGTEIEWYKNGALELVTIVTDEDRRLPLPVSKGEKWHVVVKPKDGTDFGDPATSTSVVVENAIPVIEDVTVLGDSGDVIIMYSLIDGDGDLCDLNVEYQGGSVKTAWTAATIVEPTTKVLPGTELRLTWVSKADESGQKANNYKIRITPHDGISVGTSGMSPAFALNNNSPPTAENLQILPEMPTTSDDLTASYTFVDADGDREARPEIKWYKNGIVEILYGDLTVLPSSATGKGDRWHYTIKVNDGKEYSKTQLSPHTSIGNAPPSADNVALAPEQPDLDDQLVARYTYMDPDGDSEEGTEIKWYRDGAHMLSYDNSSIIPSVVTLAGDEWYFTVMPGDGFDFGIPRTSNKVFVANMAPSASSLNISPADPLTTDDLVASYIYTDPENDPEEGSRILWYKNSVVQAKYNDMLKLPADATAKKQVWHFTVQPKDGKQYGTVQKSRLAVIRNTPPRAENLSISPLYPLSKDDLVASYDYVDVDGDLEVRTEIRWYRNDVWVPAHDGLKRLPSKNTLNGEVWYFTVRPKDDTDFGEMMTSPSVEIGSPVPRVNNLIITPGEPLTTDDLTADYIYADPNGIPEAGSQITWYGDGVAQTEYSNVKVLPRDATSKDEQWYFSVRPSNGRQFGEQQSSAPVTILNSAPKLTAVVPEPADPTTDDTIIVDYIFDDPDGDAETRNEIKWFRDGTLQSAYGGMTELPAGATARGETWHFTIRSSDGTLFSELATSSTVTVRNGRPGVANVNILPTDPLTGDDLEVMYIYIDTEADPESGTEIMWFRNGVHQTDYNNLKVVPSVATSKDDGWYCTVRPRDGIDFGDSLSSAVVAIGNTPPVAMELSALSDQILRGGSVVIVSYGQDADPVDTGLALRCQISFRVDAMQPWVELPTEYVQIPSPRWEAVFRPDASAQLGEYDFRARFTDAAGGESDWMEREKMVAVGNSPPVIDATADDFHVSEDSVKEFDLRPYGTDLESGKDLMWALDAGSVNEELFQASISGRRFLQIRPMDDKNGRDDITLTLADTDGAEVEKVDVTIIVDPVNDPPGMPASVKITPESPRTSDNLTCVAAGSTDPDNDTVVYRFQWYRDGVSQLDLRSDSVPYSRTSKGESWRCEATPSDGVSDGPSRYSEITVANTLPELTIREVTAKDVERETLNVKRGDILITFDLRDADGDNCDLKVEYRIKVWKSATVSGTGILPVKGLARGVKPGTGLTLTWRSDVDEANVVTDDCRLRITPNDGTVPGNPGESQSFFLDNKPPEFAVTAVANPIYSRYVDVTVVSDEDLVAAPDVSAVLKIDSRDIPVPTEEQPIVLDMESISEGSAPVPARIWTGKLVLEPGFDGSVLVIVEGTDLVGNTGKLELEEEFQIPPPLPRPSSFALEQNYPNPVRRDTNIPYQLPLSSIVVIKLYSATGQLVRTLDEGYRVAGFYRSQGKAAYWDGNDDNGNMIASGVYFYHLKAGDSEAVGKMIVRR